MLKKSIKETSILPKKRKERTSPVKRTSGIWRIALWEIIARMRNGLDVSLPKDLSSNSFIVHYDYSGDDVRVYSDDVNAVIDQALLFVNSIAKNIHFKRSEVADSVGKCIFSKMRGRPCHIDEDNKKRKKSIDEALLEDIVKKTTRRLMRDM